VRDAVWARRADAEVVLTHGAAPAERALTQMHTPTTGHRVAGLVRRPLLHVYGTLLSTCNAISAVSTVRVFASPRNKTKVAANTHPR
jgi:hypothetical protein